MDARLNQMLTASVYLQGSVPMNGSGTVEGCTKHRSPRNDRIRHGHVRTEAGRVLMMARELEVLLVYEA